MILFCLRFCMVDLDCSFELVQGFNEFIDVDRIFDLLDNSMQMLGCNRMVIIVWSQIIEVAC